MHDRGAQIRATKEEVADLIDRWIQRSGMRRQNLANLAGFPEYNLFYHAYLNLARGVNTEPERTIALIKAVTEGLPRERRATAEEALRFITHTRLPIDALGAIAPLFPADEWRTAGAALIGMPAEQAPATLTDPDDVRERLIRIEAALERSFAVAEPPPGVPLEDQLRRPELPPPAPLSLPHRAPLGRNALFCGRTAELHTLARLLAAHPLAAGEAVAICGLPGVGKTNLAGELMHRYGQFFSGGVFWVNCADPAAMVIEVAACGAGLISRDDWATLPVVAQAEQVRQAWQAPDERLLIFDNCEDAELLAHWRPTSGGSRLILTTRRTDWPRTAGVQRLTLDVLPRADSVALLRRYRDDLDASATPDLEALAAELGDLPLALHLAGSYLETYRHDPPFGDVQRLIADLRDHDLLGHPALQGIDTAPSGTNHDLHIARTIALSLSRLNPNDLTDARTRNLFDCAGYLAPNELFSRDLPAAALDEPHDAVRTARAMRQLTALGLLSEHGALLRIHPLVAAFARSNAAPTAQEAIERALCDLTETAHEHDDTARLRMLLPHVRLRADAAATRDDAIAVRLHIAVPHTLEAAGSINAGIAYLHRAEAQLRRTENFDTPIGAELFNNLGWWQHRVGNIAQARDYYSQALDIRRRIQPDDTAAIAESLHNLGDALRELGEVEAATSHARQALALWERALGPQHERTLAAQNTLAMLLIAQGRFSEAQDTLQRLLETATATMDADRRPIAYLHNNLAHVFAQQGDMAMSRQHFAAAAAIFHERLGAEHPDTLLTRYNALKLELQAATTPERTAELRELLALTEHILGPEHPLPQRIRVVLQELA